MIPISQRGRRAAIAMAAMVCVAPMALTMTGRQAAQAQTAPASAPTVDPSLREAGTYSIDKPHSNISFTVVHMGITKVHGRFDDFDGKVTLDDKKVENSTVEFTIQVASIDTNSVQRDTHLKTDAFFDAAKMPEITFKSTRVNKRRKGYAAVGTLTMHGVSHEIVLPFTVTPLTKGAEGGLHIGVETSIELKRSDYGMNGFPGMVGDEIPVTIELDLLKDGSVPAAPAGAPPAK